MGCDIHVMVEVRRTFGKWGPKWCNADLFSVNSWYTHRKEIAEKNGYSVDDDEPKWNLHSIYDSRNYSLFAMLSDVRNYGDTETLGYDKRGFPKDADVITQQEYDRWGGDAHTPGYCTLAELKEGISRLSKTKYSGYVHVKEHDRFVREGILPSSWSQGVYGPLADQYIWMSWEVENKDKICSKLIEAIEARKREEFHIWRPEDDDFSKDDDIRIVFWYDN